jgi:O-6-methylguanine DNA methyltransferase
MGGDDFRRRVLAAVSRIPAGRVATYGDVAAAAGNARACRAVGNIMRDCRAPGIPCHRVIAAGGNLGGFGSSPHLKRELLRAEGIQVSGSRVREFADRRWTPRPARPSQGDRSGRKATRQADGDV